MSGSEVLPAGYGDLLEQVKAEVRTSQVRATRAANSELVGLYWRLGRLILDRQQVEGWGSKVIERLAVDLRAEFPGMRGLSRRNLFYMRNFAVAYEDPEVVQRPAARLPWAHVMVLLDKLDDVAARDWYAAAAVEHGWSRAVLTHQITSGLRRRSGAAPSNFSDRLPAVDSDLAQQMLRDPYVFDFLDLTDRAGERELEAALMDRLQAFLLELGHGFAFVGRQWHFEVDGDDFYIDLLFFNWVQSRFVVVELKTGKFAPEHAGQLGFYVAWVEDNLRRPDQHAETVGILLCGGRNDRVVRYSLAGATAPLAVASYDALPAAVRDVLPSTDELADALADASGPAVSSTAAADDEQLEP